MKTIKLIILALATIVVSSNVWAQTTLTENFSASQASNNQYDCSSSITTSGMMNDFDYSWTPSGSGTVFKNGIKLGKSSGTGSVATSGMLSGISTGTAFTVKVYAAVWNTDGGQITVTYNGSSTTSAAANDAITSTSNTYSASDFTNPTNFNFTKANGVNELTIASSSKRILIDKVEVVYSSCTDPSLSFTENPINLTLSNDEASVDLSTKISKSGSGAVTYTITGGNEGGDAEIRPDGKTFYTIAAGAYTVKASLAASSPYCSDEESVTINVTAPTPPATATVTWVVNGSTYHTTSNVTIGSTISTPTNPSAPASCGDAIFKGWTANQDYFNETAAPSDLFNGTSPAITADITFYAIFADRQE